MTGSPSRSGCSGRCTSASSEACAASTGFPASCDRAQCGSAEARSTTPSSFRPPHEMQVALSDLERFLHEDSLPLLVQLAIAHYQFEVIHPFLDGNGRIGRLLIPLLLTVRGALPQPLLYLSAYFEQYRSEYYDHLLITSQSGDLMPWLAFFLRGVRRQARDSEERTVRLVELQHDLRSELLDEGRPNSVIRLAEQLFSVPVVTTARVESMIGVTRPTAQAAIDALVEREVLVETTGRERNRVYEAPAIFEAVYGAVDVAESSVPPQLPPGLV
ncbi:MAG: Fic family protein [Acidimicrobiales bacterium]